MTFTLSRATPVGVVGAGTMGTGIAQIAATFGHPVILLDASATAVERAATDLRRTLDREVSKNRMATPERDAILGRLAFHSGTDLAPLAGAGLVIEAIVERLEAKRQLFASLEGVTGSGTVFGTNTSSLAVTAVASAATEPGRVIGIHFFNPAPVMPLVEIVPGYRTVTPVVDAVTALIRAWGKTVVVAKDTPGFIVNRLARPFYGEALQILEEGIADAATIDWALRELGGFRMGPFELMDLIGNDVNYAVTRTVFEAFHYDPRYRPSLTQQRLVDAGFLGRKTGAGYYAYGAESPPPEPTRDPVVGQRIVDRIVALLINGAVDALHYQIASVADLDMAMTRGVNYPRGLLAWGDQLGWDVVLARVDALQQETGDDRYRPSPLLRRLARNGTRLTA